MAYDLQFGAGCVFMEASAEPPEGQRAVAWVLVNRLRDGRWGSTLASVCLAPYQFSSFNTGDPNRKRLAQTPDNDPTLKQIEGFVQDALNGVGTDPTNGALWYVNEALAKPDWMAEYVQTAKIGNHTFFRQP